MTRQRGVLALFLLALVFPFGCSGGTPKVPPSAGEPEKQSPGPAIKQRFSLDTGMRRGEQNSGGPTALAVSADGKLLLAMASLGEDAPANTGNVQLWDLDKQQKLHQYDNPSGTILPVAISPDRKMAAYYAYTKGVPRVVLIDALTGKELRVLTAKAARLDLIGTGLCFSPKGDLLVVASGKTIVGWDPASGEERFTWTDDAEIQSLSSFFNDGKKLASANKAGVIKLWDVTTGKPVQMLSHGGKDTAIANVAVTSDGKTLVSKPMLGDLKVWDLAQGKAQKDLNIRTALWYSLLFRPNSRTLVYNGNKDVNLLDVQSGVAVQETNAHGDSFIQCLTLTPDGSTLLTGDNKGTIKVWDLK